MNVEPLKISPIYTIKVVLAGGLAVGKSSITHLLNNESLKPLDPTIGLGFAHKMIELEEYPLKDIPDYYYMEKDGGDKDVQTIKTQVWDCAGSEKFRNIIVNSYLRNIDIVFFIYDMSERESWLELEKWKADIEKNRFYNEIPLFVLVGNKTDKMPYQVTSEEIKERCEKWGALNYTISCVSQRANESINRMFYKCVQYYHEILLTRVRKNREIPYTKTIEHFQSKSAPLNLNDVNQNLCCIVS